MIDLKSAASNPWLLDPERLAALHRHAARVAHPGNLPKIEPRIATAAMRKTKGKIAVLSVQGIIEQRTSLWGWLFGSFATSDGEAALDRLVKAPDISCIVLDIDSPGGTSYGVEEFAGAVQAAKAAKPVYAIANSIAGSAAYWIASQATQLVVTPSGEVGSIGAYIMHTDCSEALAEDGVKVTIVKAGKYKAEGNPYEALTDAGRDQMQATVDALYTRFVKAVAAGRGTSPDEVRSKMGQGRMVPAEKAVAAGMADKVMTFSQLLDRLGGEGLAPIEGSRMSAEMLRLQHEQRKRLTAVNLP
jgi:capsid assembly protease